MFKPATTSCFAASVSLLAPRSAPRWRLSFKLPLVRGPLLPVASLAACSLSPSLKLKCSEWRLSLPRARASEWRESESQAAGAAELEAQITVSHDSFRFYPAGRIILPWSGLGPSVTVRSCQSTDARPHNTSIWKVTLHDIIYDIIS